MGYVTNNDRKILHYMERYKTGATIKQLAMMFFPQNQHSYSYAQRRLNTLYTRGLLKRYTNKATDEYVYYYSDKVPREHEVFSMTLYALLISMGLEIIEYERDWDLLDGKYRCDFFTVFRFGSEYKAILGEVDLHNHNPTNIKKYEELYKSGIMQQEYGGFPLVVIISPIKRDLHSDNFTILNMDLNLSYFVEKVLSL